MFRQQNKQKNFERLLKARKAVMDAYRSIEEADEKGKDRQKTKMKANLPLLYHELEEATEGMIDLDKGVFVGVGVDLVEPNKREEPIYLKFENQNNHTIHLGTTRVGKTRCMINMQRHLIAKGMNVLIVDPKGSEDQEIMAWVQEHLNESDRSHDYVYISPVFPELSLFFNPLEGLSNEEISSMVAMLTTTGTDLNSDAQFFSSVAYKTVMTVLSALEYLEVATDPLGELVDMQRKKEIVNYHIYTDMKGKEPKGFDAVNKIILPDVIDRLSATSLKSATENSVIRVYDRTFVTFRELARYTNPSALNALRENVKSIPLPAEDLVGKEKHREIIGIRRQAETLLDDVLSQDPQFFQKISVSLSTLLTQLSVGRIGQVFCTVRINPLLHRMHREDRGFVALIQPAPMKFQKVSDMAVKIILKMFQSAMGTVGASGVKYPKRTAVLIDEAGAVMFPGIHELFNKAGGLGMSLYLYTQSFKDLHAALGDKYSEVVLDNINTYNIMRTNDNSSKKQASEQLGNIRKKKTVLMSGTTADAMRMNTQIVSEPIMEPDHFMRLTQGRGVLIHDGKRYMVDYAYVPDPRGKLTMPSLEENVFRDEMAKLELEIENSINGALNSLVEKK